MERMRGDTDGLGLQFVEHGRFLVENVEDLCELGVAALHNKGNIFQPFTFSSNFDGTRYIVLLLFGAIEPTQEKACALGLLSTLSATHIQQDVRILAKELFNDAHNRLCYLPVVRRRLLIKIGEIEPISSKVRIVIEFKIHSVKNAIVGLEQVLSIRTQPNLIIRMGIDEVQVEGAHFLYGEIKVMRLFGATTLVHNSLQFLLCFFLPSLLALSCSIKPRENFLARALLPYYSCFHRTNLSVLRCKSRHNQRTGKKFDKKSSTLTLTR